VRILEVAERMIEMAGRDIEIVFTGLREGEKLHEALLAEGEGDHRPLHPMISHTKVPPFPPGELDRDHWLREWRSDPHADERERANPLLRRVN
jgi:FlaA1/EpsC-like NDP-sugar epimerase